MKSTAENKSSYDKLYLIHSDMYNRILPLLNEVDKQEINDINEKNRPFEENDETFGEKNEEQKNDDAEEINDDVIMHPHPKNEEANIDNPTIPVEEPKIDKPKISVKMVKNANGDWSIEKTPRKKMKKFACEICVNKKFTTKRSLKRHSETFHGEKHSIKETQVTPEVIRPYTSSSETGGKASFIDEPKSKNLKRKFQYNPGEFHLVRNNQAFSRDEPVIKQPRGINSKVPKRTKIKRKFDDNSGDLERRIDDDDDVIMERYPDEPVVKLPNSMKKRKFNLDEF